MNGGKGELQGETFHCRNLNLDTCNNLNLMRYPTKTTKPYCASDNFISLWRWCRVLVSQNWGIASQCSTESTICSTRKVSHLDYADVLWGVQFAIIPKSHCKEDFKGENGINWGPNIVAVGPTACEAFWASVLSCARCNETDRSLNILMYLNLPSANNMATIPEMVTCP